MTWTLVACNKAIADALGDLGGGVQVAAFPQTTINPPSAIVLYPEPVTIGTRALGIDTATVTIACAVGLAAPDGAMDALLASVRDAITADPTLGGAVLVARPVQFRNMHSANVAGVDVFRTDFVIEVDI